MSYYGDPTTDMPPPRQWESGQERKEWFAEKPITHHFADAVSAFVDIYGEFDRSNARYHANHSVILKLLKEPDVIDIVPPYSTDPEFVMSMWGIGLRTDDSLANMACVLIVGGNEYRFEIPEQRKVKPPRRPECPPGEWQYTKWLDGHKPNRIRQVILSFIDWLNRRTGAGDKPKCKRKDDATEPWLKVTRNILYPFYGKKFLLSTEYKPKRKTNGEQMATLGELFEGYEEYDNGGLLTVDEIRAYLGDRLGGGRTGQR